METGQVQLQAGPASFTYRFDWNPAKRSPTSSATTGSALSSPHHAARPAGCLRHEAHSETEDRWITLGQARNGQLLVVVHTFDEIDAENARVRPISAPKATLHERRHYEDQ